MIKKYSDMNKVYESPDAFIKDNGVINWWPAKTHAFGYFKNKFVVGGVHSNHTKLIDGARDRHDFKYPGRIWVDDYWGKAVSFWVYPKKNIFVEIINNLEKELKIKIWNNNYLLEIPSVNSFTIDKYNSDEDFFGYIEINDIEKAKKFFTLIPIEEYNPDSKLINFKSVGYDSEHVISPLLKSKNKKMVDIRPEKIKKWDISARRNNLLFQEGIKRFNEY